MFSYVFPFTFFSFPRPSSLPMLSLRRELFFYIYHATYTSGFGSKFYKEMERTRIVALDPFVSSPGTYWFDLRFGVKSEYCHTPGTAR